MLSTLFATLLLLTPSVSVMAQVEEETQESDVINTTSEEEDYKDTWKTPYVSDEMTRDSEQNKSWRMGEYKFSSKPKNSWEFGFHVGHFFIDGDVDRTIPGGFGLGLHLRKAVNYMFSLRGSVFYGMATGIESQPYRHRSINGGLVEPVFDMYDPNSGGPGEWFPAHRTRYISGNLAVIFNIGNLLFHKERNKWNWYAGLGLGLDTHEAMLDLTDANGNPYGSDGAPLRQAVGWTFDKFNTRAGRNEIETMIKDLYDGVYETPGQKKPGIFRLGDDINVHVVFIPSMGITRKINKRLNVGIEHQIFLSDNDYLDGIKFRTAVDQTNNVDIGHYTSLRIGFNIGNFDKVTEPLYWLNPMDQAFNEIANIKNQPQLDLTDEDNDGVIDMLDQELDTPEGCPVDTRGVLLDSDGDGLADCEDKEPYSRPGCPIDEYGVANCNDKLNDSSQEQINSMIDTKLQEFSTSSEFMGQTTVREVTNPDGTTTIIREPVSSGGTVTRTVTNEDGTTTIIREPARSVVSSGCGDWFLPMIHYDLNKSSIKPEYYSHLHNVAQVMEKCPNVCVTAQGHTDSRNSNDYNKVLSYKRAKAAIEHLVDNYGIDRSRFRLMYGGEDNPMVSAANNESHHFMNRRVEFRTCNSDDYDMNSPAGTSDAGNTGSAPADYYNGNKSSGY